MFFFAFSLRWRDSNFFTPIFFSITFSGEKEHVLIFWMFGTRYLHVRSFKGHGLWDILGVDLPTVIRNVYFFVAFHVEVIGSGIGISHKPLSNDTKMEASNVWVGWVWGSRVRNIEGRRIKMRGRGRCGRLL